MKVNVAGRKREDEDPFMEKLINSMVIAFVAAAVIKLGMFIYTTCWGVSEVADWFVKCEVAVFIVQCKNELKNELEAKFVFTICTLSIPLSICTF